MVEIVPSILSANFARLAEEITRVERGGATMLHLDVMDGHFVPNLTIGPPVVESIRQCTRLHLDVHLMIENPERYVTEFVKAGANSVLVKSVPANSVVVGVPGRPVTRSRAHAPQDDPDLQHTVLPDAIGAMLTTLMARVDRLEKPSAAEEPLPHTPAPDAEGIWHGEDFSI